jgi:quercetin dioxygenase-like cupin family protein
MTEPPPEPHTIPPAETSPLATLLEAVRRNRVDEPVAASCLWESTGASSSHYQNQDRRQGIDFQVFQLPFPQLQVMDPRLVRIAAGCSNEKHRHAHESIFVVLSGSGRIQIGHDTIDLEPGSVACVPRWVVHQSHNRSAEQELVLLAITDFGLTSAVLGNYDASTRLRHGGADAFVSTSA